MAGVPPPGRLPGGQTDPRPDVIGDLSRCRRWRGSHAVINDHRPPARLVVVGRVVERPPAVPLGDRYRTATLVLPAPGSPALLVLPIPSDSLTGAVPPRRSTRRRQGEGAVPPFARAVVGPSSRPISRPNCGACTPPAPTPSPIWPNCSLCPGPPCTGPSSAAPPARHDDVLAE